MSENQTPAIQSDIARISVSLAIENIDEFNAVGLELARFKDKLKEVDADEKNITAPINKSLKEIRAKYKPVKESLEKAIVVMRQAMNDYKRAEDIKREADRLALEELSKSGEATITELIELVDEAPSLGGRLTTIVEANQVQMTVKYKLELLARVWDTAMVVVRKDVAAGRVEDGVTVRKEKML